MGTVSAHAQSIFPSWFRGFRFAIPKTEWFLRDGEYAPHSPIARLEAYLISTFCTHQTHSIAKAIDDVAQELSRQLLRNPISHLVVYGSNRKIVAANILLNSAFSSDVVMVLSEAEISRESLIAKRINHQLSLKQISLLPVALEDVKSSELDLPKYLINTLYSDNRLVGPYQVDTDRYPFAKCFV
ncbi:MAG: hypothetical protein P8103_07900 [Candidatus Thiodiazotropha sp.]